VSRQARQRAREGDERFRDAETKPGRDAEDEAVDRLREIGAVRKEQRREGLEDLLHHRHQESEEEQSANADAGSVQRVADSLVGVVDDPLEHRDHDPDDRSAADGETQHEGGLVAIDLRLVEVDQIQDRDQEDRDQDGRGDQARDVEDEDAGQADGESPPKLVDLGVAQVRKQGGEDRWLDDVLGRVGRVAVHAGLRRGRLRDLSLVRAAAGAENAVRDVVRAVVAAHGGSMRENPDGFPSSAGRFATGLLPLRYTVGTVFSGYSVQPLETLKTKSRPG